MQCSVLTGGAGTSQGSRAPLFTPVAGTRHGSEVHAGGEVRIDFSDVGGPATATPLLK